MKVTLVQRVLAMALLSGTTAWAQEASTPAPPIPVEVPQEAPPPAPAPVPVEVAPAVNPVNERMAALESRLAKAEEKTSALESSVSSLKKLKLSGYVQGRYEWHDDAMAGWKNAKNQNRFSVRHGYLGARYEGPFAEFFLQIDANTADGVVLKDAEATLVDPWTPLHLKLTVGQFKLPFGYEITQSDAERELPERAAVITGLFANDRDRGLRLTGKYEVLRLGVAFVNGATLFHKDPTDKNGFTQNGYAPQGPKTVAGRLGVDLGSFVLGLSGLWGRTLETGKNPLENYDDTTYRKYEQVRLGADAQGYVDIPVLGALALKGEIIWGRKKSLDYQANKANPCLESRSLGWILTLVQNLGPYAGVAIRLDQYDPMLASKVPAVCHDPTVKETAARDKDKVTRLGVAGLLYASANAKLSLSYEHPWEQTGAKVSNDIVTAQLQARF